MRKTIFALFAALGLCALPFSSAGQNPVFGGGIAVLGVSNLVAGTNTYLGYPVKQVAPVQITFTNASSICTNNVLATLDKTNFVNIGKMIIYSSNGVTFQTNFVAYTTNLPVYIFLGAATGTNTVTYLATYGP